MKKLLLILAVLLAAGGMVTADTGAWSEPFTQDARVMGMGGAFTAVADDIYALFYNPAGLAYLDGIDLLLGFTMYSRLNSAEVDKVIDNPEYEPDNPFNMFEKLIVTPRAGFASRNWGLAAISNINVNSFIIDEDADTLNVSLTNNLGLMGGFGMNFGPIAVGGNARLYKSVEINEAYTEDTFPHEDEIFSILFDPEKIADAEDNFKVGVGAMVTLGSLTAGAYVDDFLTLVGEDVDGLEDIFSQALKTAKVGAAFTPFKNRLNPQQFSLLNLIIAADINNIGDDEKRSMNIGTEVGLHLGNAIKFDMRGGYQQFVGDDFSFAPENGEVFFGFGSKLLFLDMNWAVSVPAEYFQAVIEADEELPFGDYGNPRFIVSGGIRL